MNYAEHCTTDGNDAMYVDFMNDNMQVYEEVTDTPKLRSYLNEKLEQYNMQPKLIKMDLVLFMDAITHIAKIYRIINLKRGHAFLVGVGGSGRHSLTRLAAFVSQMNVFQLEVTKGFNLKHFREFLKVMYEMAAFRGKEKLKTVFIFSDNDVVQESFLEDIQNMLNGGVVPNLYNNEELNKIREDLRRPFKKAGNTVETPDLMNDFFFGNIKDNLHLSICMSPIGQAFKDYCRMYPALINNTTIDWFMPWPADALTEVAMKFIGKMDLDEGLHSGLATLCSYAHQTTGDMSLLMR
jgi:dynein heavy chain